MTQRNASVRQDLYRISNIPCQGCAIEADLRALWAARGLSIAGPKPSSLTRYREALVY